ncbi:MULTISPECIES: hypothetical protein [Nocardiopsidaceae]|uniref:Uncharacterized protein n=1 Tax=Streptomonospora salina TaxID=104205 RepID=A0A841EDY4_9ACTN|nr:MULTISPECIES: hypothetical protein [Nocardiopsaceae]MBB5999253.1 hypothetical protein [Streptomonospora salina]
MSVVTALACWELVLGVCATGWMVGHARSGRDPARQPGFRPLVAAIAVSSAALVIALVS